MEISLLGAAAIGLAAAAAPPRVPPVSLVGITMPSKVAAVAPEQAGKIVEVPVTDGDRVDTETVLFRLNSTLEQLEVDRLAALVDSDVFERRAVAGLEFAERQAARVQNLRDQEISSERDLQTQVHELELARLRLEQTRLEKSQTINELAQARERLAQRTVKSPFAGIVTQRLRGTGEAVEKFVPVVEVMSLDPLWIEFECPITEQHLFKKGGRVVVAPAVRPDDSRTATILFASPKATASSHTFTVRASVANPDLAWKTGQKMAIELPGNEAPPSRPGK